MYDDRSIDIIKDGTQYKRLQNCFLHVQFEGADFDPPFSSHTNLSSVRTEDHLATTCLAPVWVTTTLSLLTGKAM